MRNRLTWLTRGDRYAVVLDEHAASLRELQEHVAALAEVVARLDRDTIVREELTSVTDDLAARVGALSQRLAGPGA
jgi:hypothetical protein